MKKLNHIYIKLFTFTAILAGCSGSPVSVSTNSITVDIKPQLENPVTLNAVDIISEMRYVALETTDSSLLGNIEFYAIIRQNEHFFIQYDQGLYIFDDKGQYIRQIGRQGQGPEEYVRLFNFDVDNDFIYLYDGARQRMLVYSYDNKYLRTVNVRSDSISVTRIKKLPDGFLCYQEPALLYNKYRKPVPDLILFDENGNIKKILHYRTLNIDSLFPYMFGPPSPTFKKHNDKLFIYLPLQDTIFSVSGENLNTEIVINRGEHAVYPESIDNREKQQIADEKGVFVNSFTVNDNCLVLYCEYRKQNITFMYSFKTNELKNVSKIINDFDDTYDISTFDLNGNQMLDRKLAFEIIEEDRIPESLKNLDEEDNPVIRISTLK
jgi:hypothetical protein